MKKSLIIFVGILTLLSYRDLCSKENRIWVDANTKKNGATGSKESPFNNINEAVKNASPNSTIIIKPGIYPEPVNIINKKNLTIKPLTKDKVFVYGTKQIGNWKKFKKNIYISEIDNIATSLFINNIPAKISRFPQSGWWSISDFKNNILFDRKNLKYFTPKHSPGNIFIWTKKGNVFFNETISNVNKKNFSITLLSKNKWMKLSKGDKYFFINHPDLIKEPGQWACIKNSNGKYNLYLHPKKLSDLKKISISAIKNQVINVNNCKNINISGIHVAGSRGNGITINNSKNVTISKSIFRNNKEYGIFITGSEGIKLENNISWHNSTGITIKKSKDINILQNDIGFNNIDGIQVTWNTEKILIYQNYIHDHIFWGHPDNIQTYRQVSDIKIIDNLLLNAMQSIMMEETTGGIIKGNLIIGSESHMIIFGHRNAGNFTLESNTAAYPGYGCLQLTWKNYRLNNNVFITGQNNPAIFTENINDYYGKNNIFYKYEKSPNRLVFQKNRNLKNIAEIDDSTTKENNSVYEDIKASNSPIGSGVIDSNLINKCTEKKLFIRNNSIPFKNGDYIEINFDGIIRKITKSKNDFIEIKPVLNEKPLKAFVILNWGKNKKFKINLTSIDINKGSKINMENYKKGDFNGDGNIDIPAIDQKLIYNTPRNY